MDTKILKPDENGIKLAGKIVASGGLVAFPTETVYGLGASAFDDEATAKIYKAKGRPSDNPLIVHVGDVTDIVPLAEEISDNGQKLINRFMPGPFTIIVKKSDKVAHTVTAGMNTVAIRCPENATARQFIKSAGVPVAAPSANLSGKPSPTKASHVIDDMTGRIDAIIDGEDCRVGVESTIVDASRDIPVLLRPGGITLEELRQVVPDIRIDEHVLSSVAGDEKPLCPGMKYKHYSPEADVTVVEGDVRAVKKKIDEMLRANTDKVCGVLTMSNNTYDSAVILSGGTTGQEYATRLFAHLREFDRLGVEVVFAELCGDDGFVLAIKNRLYKAAGQKVIIV